MVSPVKLASGPWSTCRTEFGPPFQPAIVPSRVANRNVAGLPMPGGRRKSVVGLNTWPVGLPSVPAGLDDDGEMVMTVACGLPLPSYWVTLPVAWLETENGPPGANATPHGFF